MNDRSSRRPEHESRPTKKARTETYPWSENVVEVDSTDSVCCVGNNVDPFAKEPRDRIPYPEMNRNYDSSGSVDCTDLKNPTVCSIDKDCFSCRQFGFVCLKLDKDRDIYNKDGVKIGTLTKNVGDEGYCLPSPTLEPIDEYTSEYIVFQNEPGNFNLIIRCLYPDTLTQTNLFSNCNKFLKCGPDNRVKNKITGIEVNNFNNVGFDIIKDGECICPLGLRPGTGLQCVSATIKEVPDCFGFDKIPGTDRCSCPDTHVYTRDIEALKKLGFKDSVIPSFEINPASCVVKPCRPGVYNPATKSCECPIEQFVFGVYVEEEGDGNAVNSDKFNACLQLFKNNPIETIVSHYIPPIGDREYIFKLSSEQLLLAKTIVDLIPKPNDVLFFVPDNRIDFFWPDKIFYSDKFYVPNPYVGFYHSTNDEYMLSSMISKTPGDCSKEIPSRNSPFKFKGYNALHTPVCRLDLDQTEVLYPKGEVVTHTASKDIFENMITYILNIFFDYKYETGKVRVARNETLNDIRYLDKLIQIPKFN